MPEAADPRWLLLITQLPPKPEYLRVKVWRRLQKIGAVGLRGAVYVLPYSEDTYEDFEWTIREITEAGGESTLCEARFVEGTTDEQIVALFNAARDADYAQVAEELRAVETAPGLTRVARRFAEVTKIDFFEAPSRSHVGKLLTDLETKLAKRAEVAAKVAEEHDLAGRTWVTRRGVGVDRMACAWLIRRFIDPAARIKLVAAKQYRHDAGELRFDMFEGEFTHEADRCSFEVLLARCGFHDRALATLAEVVHDLDLKDDKYGRAETPGLGVLIDAISGAHKDDESRLARSAAALDDLYEWFKRRRS